MVVGTCDLPVIEGQVLGLPFFSRYLNVRTLLVKFERWKSKDSMECLLFPDVTHLMILVDLIFLKYN